MTGPARLDREEYEGSWCSDKPRFPNEFWDELAEALED